MVIRAGLLAAGLLAGLQASTQFVAWSFYWAPGLGGGIILFDGLILYAPWSVLRWRAALGAEAPQVFAIAGALLVAGPTVAVMSLVLLERTQFVRRRRGWGTLADARRAGLLKGANAS